MKKILLAVLLLSGMAFGQVARTGGCATANNNCTLSATAANDLQIAIVFRGGSSTAPALATGWTSVATSSGTTPSYRIACRKASSSGDTASGSFSNGSHIVIASYSGTSVNTTADCNTTGVGATAAGSPATGTTVTFPSLTLVQTTGADWVLGAMAASTSTSICTPSVLTQFASATATFGISGSDTNAGVASFAGGTCTVSSETTRAVVAEVKGNVPTVADPSISPSTGTQTSGPQTVTITDSTSGATICYRTDGTSPAATTAGTCDAGSTTYSGTFNVGSAGNNSVTTVKAIGTKSGSLNSAVVTSTITIQYAATPTISPSAGSYFTQQTITLACSTGSSSIYYTTDGTTPTTSSTLYTGTFSGASSGSQTIKALCTATGYGNSAVALNAYSIAPSDTAASITDDFSAYYDSNLAINHVQQFPLDTIPTKGKWKAVGGISGDIGVQEDPDNAIAPVRAAVQAAATSGYAVGSNSGKNLATVTFKTGFDNDQWAQVKVPVGGSNGGVCVRCSTSGAKTGYYLLVSTTTATLGKFVNGTDTVIATTGATMTGITAPFTVRLRVAGTQLQPLLNGSTPVGLSANYTDTSISSGNPGIATSGTGGYVSDFSAGNVGVADGTSTATYTPTNPTYTDAAMSTSSWALGWPWVRAQINYMLPAPGAGWGNPFTPLQISGSLYGIGVTNTGQGSGQMSYRGGEFGSDQWQKFKVGLNPHSALSNWFAPLQHLTYIPGTTGGCAAAGNTAHCFDTVSYYPGVETYGTLTNTNGCLAGKTEYQQTPFLHVTKVTPARTDDAVITVAGSSKTPLKTDEIYEEYQGNHIRVACKRNASVGSWASGTVYAANTYIIDGNGNLQHVLTGGTSGGSAPTFGTSWDGTNCHGATATDNTVTWQYAGKPCSTSWEWVIDAVDTDLAGANGIPALWAAPNATDAVFYDWSAGTATSSTSMTQIGIAQPSSYQPAPVIFW